MERLATVTGTCGPAGIYRGDLFGKAYRAETRSSQSLRYPVEASRAH